MPVMVAVALNTMIAPPCAAVFCWKSELRTVSDPPFRKVIAPPLPVVRAVQLVNTAALMVTEQVAQSAKMQPPDAAAAERPFWMARFPRVKLTLLGTVITLDVPPASRLHNSTRGSAVLQAAVPRMVSVRMVPGSTAMVSVLFSRIAARMSMLVTLVFASARIRSSSEATRAAGVLVAMATGGGNGGGGGGAHEASSCWS